MLNRGLRGIFDLSCEVESFRSSANRTNWSSSSIFALVFSHFLSETNPTNSPPSAWSMVPAHWSGSSRGQVRFRVASCTPLSAHTEENLEIAFQQIHLEWPVARPSST